MLYLIYPVMLCLSWNTKYLVCLADYIDYMIVQRQCLACSLHTALIDSQTSKENICGFNTPSSSSWFVHMGSGPAVDPGSVADGTPVAALVIQLMSCWWQVLRASWAPWTARCMSSHVWPMD